MFLPAVDAYQVNVLERAGVLKLACHLGTTSDFSCEFLHFQSVTNI